MLYFYRLYLLLTWFFPGPIPAPALPSPGCDADTPTTYAEWSENGVGTAVLEAERPTTGSPSTHTGHNANVRWTEYTSNSAGSGGYLIVPTAGQDALDQPLDGATLTFDIDFTHTGTHYLYVRYTAFNEQGNSLHASFDGALFQESLELPVLGGWYWFEAPLTFDVTTPGIHTVAIHHAEDGLHLDKLVVSTESGTTFDRFGPEPTPATPSPDLKDADGRISHSQDNRTADSLLVVEAEDFTNATSGVSGFDCTYWEAATDPGASGGTYLTTDAYGVTSDSSNYTQTARLDYYLENVSAGLHYIYVRHRATTGQDGIWIAAGTTTIADFDLTDSGGQWVWQKSLDTFNLIGPGLITLSVYPKSDGTQIDKIIITTNDSYVPDGFAQFNTIERPPDRVYQEEDVAGDYLDIPAESPSRNRGGIDTFSTLRWTELPDTAANGGRYVVVGNAGGSGQSAADTLSDSAPLLEYDVNFKRAGMHYLWARHRSPTVEDNSYTLYLNGDKLSEVELPAVEEGDWTYSNTDGAAFAESWVSFDVVTTGIQRLGLAMREDGTPIDHLIVSDDAVLPLEFADFTVETRDHANVLEWVTRREKDTYLHHLQRSPDGRGRWTDLRSLSAAGHTDRELRYTVEDGLPPPIAYYRVVTEDLDGSLTYSGILSAIRKPATEMTLSPNPATDRATLTFAHRGGTEATIVLSTIAGIGLATRSYPTDPGENRVDLPLQRFVPGIYLVTLRLGDEVRTQRLVIGR